MNPTPRNPGAVQMHGSFSLGGLQASAMLVTFALAGCSSLIEKHFVASQKLVEDCAKLSGSDSSTPSGSLAEFLAVLESRAWPQMASCQTTAVQLEISFEPPTDSKDSEISVLIEGLAPLWPRKGEPLRLTYNQPGVPQTVSFDSVDSSDGSKRKLEYSILQPLGSAKDLPLYLNGKLKSDPALVPLWNKDNNSRSASLLSCGLIQNVVAHVHLGSQEQAASEVFIKIAGFESTSRSSAESWTKLKQSLKIGADKKQDKQQTYAALLEARNERFNEWAIFQQRLDALLISADELEKSLRSKALPPTFADFQIGMLGFVANVRATIGKSKLALVDQGQFARDLARGQLTENFARRYLNVIDRSLSPLERAFDRFDEKVLGFGTVATLGLEHNIDEALSGSYKQFENNLCTSKGHEAEVCKSRIRDFDIAVGRAACKRMDQPVAETRSPWLMQYVYRFYTGIAAEALSKKMPLNQATDTASASAETIRESQLAQHALAEWTVRGEMIAQDLKEQSRSSSASSAVDRTKPSVAPNISARMPDENQVEERATALAATQIVDAWTRRDATSGDNASSFARQMTFSNNIALSQHLAVQMVNQQTVVNSINLDARQYVANPVQRTASPLRLETGPIQVNIPTVTLQLSTAHTEGLAKPKFVLPPGLCTSIGPVICAELVDGFEWTLPYAKAETNPIQNFADNLSAFVGAVERLKEAKPLGKIRIEVQGYASREPYTCSAMMAAGKLNPKQMKTRKEAAPDISDLAPPCDRKGDANPRLSFERAKYIREQLIQDFRLRTVKGIQFAPPLANGEFADPMERKVVVRALAIP